MTTPAARVVLLSVQKTVLIYSISKDKVKREQRLQRVYKKIFPQRVSIENNIMIFWHIFYNRGILAARITISAFSWTNFS